MTVDPTFLSNFLLISVGFTAAFLAALWLSLIFWVFRDIRRRTRDTLVHILAVLVVAILFLPGMLIYFILRPPRTLEEEFQQSLEEEALLQTIEESLLCPGCGRKVKEDWVVCPACYTRLKKTCHQCGKAIELSWNLCPYCGTPAPGMRRETLSIDDAMRNLVMETEIKSSTESVSSPEDPDQV
ncbi:MULTISPECIES: zinc ribbon domain-containing protein [Anaerolinea]|uniref:zinc ribbon domain-containing protein n=1 Tax=Anaerolinea TaxID=233189 RepID=UPI0026242D94|nr:zinc ribbon domain-containing protein [Anaerolinea thermophila]